MSAICGLVNFDGEPVDPDLLRRMAESAVHHGPDGIRYWIEGNVGLAHLAFNTTPESLRESQPLLTDDGTLCLVADGRIDNRPELINILSQQGYPITINTSDAGLILAAYQHWGEAVPNHLVGDFAFAVWDKRQHRLFCARDVFGIKPLVYSQVGNLFCFATEAQQILQHPAISPKLDETRVADFLIVNDREQSHTFFIDIKYLPAAHYLTTIEDQLILSQYWDWPVADQIYYSRREAYVENFNEVFRRAVHDRLRSVVPTIGINLSGGLDSSSVAAVATELLKKQTNRHLTAQTLVFDELPFEDERIDSQLIADYLDINIEFIANDNVPLLIQNGIIDPTSPYKGWEQTEHNLLKHFRTQGGQVLLTGLGGDDLVGGSALVNADQLRRGNLLALGRLWGDARINERSFWKILYSWFIRPRLPQAITQRQFKDQSNQLSASIPIWIRQDFARQTNLAERLQPQPPIQSKSWARQVIHQSVSQMGDVYRMYIHWQSRLAVRQQIVYRHPFLDRRLCEFVLRLPPEQLWHAGLSKYILRQAMANRLPEKVRLRPRKTTYAVVTHQRLQDKEARQISQLLEDPLMVKLGFVNSQKLQEGLRAYFTGQQDGRTALSLIRLVSLEIWLLNHSFLQL